MPKQAQKSVFRVVDALDGPHRGRIIRLRMKSGQPPALKDLKGATLLAQSPDGEQESLKVVGFFAPGGKPSDARLKRTGRVDLVVERDDDGSLPQISIQWEVSVP